MFGYNVRCKTFLFENEHFNTTGKTDRTPWHPAAGWAGWAPRSKEE